MLSKIIYKLIMKIYRLKSLSKILYNIQYKILYDLSY
jgi:hypothetical protein